MLPTRKNVRFSFFPHDLNVGFRWRPTCCCLRLLIGCFTVTDGWYANALSLPRPQLRKVERDKKTMDQEIVQLTNKLLEAKNTIDHLEELNVRTNSHLCKNVQLPGQSSKCQVFHSETTGSKNYCVITSWLTRLAVTPLMVSVKPLFCRMGFYFV